MGRFPQLTLRSQTESRWDGPAIRPLSNAGPGPNQRTWGFLTFNAFWFAAVANVTVMLNGSSFLSLGLSFWEGVGCSTAGYFLVSILMVLNGRIGSVYHVGFPIACRSSFGIVGSLFPVIIRCISSVLWNGINSVSGGQCIYIMLHSIFPSIANMKNTMSSSSALDSAGILCFFLFLFLTGAMVVIDARKWGWLIYLKVAVFIVSTAAMLALSITKAGGVGPVVSRASTLNGSAKAWTIVQQILLNAASCATFASNAADWQRNAVRANDPIVGQLIGFPLANMIVQIFGMLIASTSEAVYGELVWSPSEYLKMLLEDNYDAKHRAGAFFIALGFTYCLLFSVAVENLLPFANDISSVWPRWLNIRRSMFLGLACTAAINPWYLLGSASIFITVIASYQIFLFAVAAINLTDYFVISKGLIDIDQLYTGSKHGKFFYTYGFNWRAFAAYLVGVAINFAGFLQNFNGILVGHVQLQRSYWFAIFTTTAASSLTYYALARLFPPPNYVAGGWQEPKDWEPGTPVGPFGTSLGTASHDGETSYNEKELDVSSVKPASV